MFMLFVWSAEGSVKQYSDCCLINGVSRVLHVWLMSSVRLPRGVVCQEYIGNRVVKETIRWHQRGRIGNDAEHCRRWCVWCFPVAVFGITDWHRGYWTVHSRYSGCTHCTVQTVIVMLKNYIFSWPKELGCQNILILISWSLKMVCCRNRKPTCMCKCACAH